MQMFKLVKPTLISAWAAHALAWIAGLLLALGPVFGGESDGEQGAATLVEVAGAYGIFVLLVPVALTGVVLWAVWRGAAGDALLWGVALGLSGLCVLSAGSIGMFYVPAALALVATAVINPGKRSS